MRTIVDDLGYTWRYNALLGRVICEGDDTEDGGYPCDSLDDARATLIEFGYLTAPARAEGT